MEKKQTKNAVTTMYRSWRKANGNRRPNRAGVVMYWEDEGPEETHADTVALQTYDIQQKDDDRILFYTGTLKGLLELMQPNNGSEFVVTEVTGFFYEE